MNEFTAKKLAEVSAFGGLCRTVIAKAGSGFATDHPDVVKALRQIDVSRVPEAISADRRELYDGKVAKTTAKLEEMMELYVGDEWGNPVEVLEWSSFFTGAGAAHCALAAGVTSADQSSELHRSLVLAEEHFAAALRQILIALTRTGESKS